MNHKSIVIFVIFVVVLFAAPSANASKKAAVRYTRPSEFHIEGIKKLAFAPFSFEMTYHEKGSKHIPQILMEEIAKEGFFKVVGPKKIKPLEMDSEMSIPQLVRYGRKAGADGVIYGEITAFQVSEYERGGMLNTADVSFCMELINVKRGKAVDRKCFSKSGAEVLKAIGELEGTPRDERMVLGVAKKAAEEIARALMPRRSKQDIPFDYKKGCKAGVNAALKGNWASAETSWLDTLSGDQNCNCALYNMGLSNEVKTNYTKALDYYKRALSLKPDRKLYKSAVKRVNLRIREEKTLKAQMRGR